MELDRLPRRSASHGTLRSNYVQHGRPRHKPLRSVNENSALLPSPGALESMLKTTTETGNIGIFSIKPVRASSNLGHGQVYPPPRRSVDEIYSHHGPRRLPNYRDATSEILSMYGSNSQSSVTSTLFSSMDESGPRSYSMTTCGSKHLSHHKSSLTLHSQASGSNLQRPRSPYPYPTRLKRPGARPASPAVTENGSVDYSRMVEIDRISLRTCKPPFKPPCRPPVRRPPPLGLRADANQSTPTLQGYGPLPIRYPARGPPSLRTTSAASVVSRNGPYRERLDSVSSRTSSLISVPNAYHRMPAVLKASHLSNHSQSPHYYDYTEEFESKQVRPETPKQPFAPVPTRASSVQRHFVLREGSDEQLAAALGVDADTSFFEGDSHPSDSQTDVIIALDTFDSEKCGTNDQDSNALGGTTYPIPSLADSPETDVALRESQRASRRMRGSDIDLLPSQIGRGSMETFNPSLDVESKNLDVYDYSRFRATAASKTNTASPQRQVQVQGSGTPTIRSEQGVILRSDVQGDGDEGLVEDGDRNAAPSNKGTNQSAFGLDQSEQQLLPEPRQHPTSSSLPLENTTPTSSCNPVSSDTSTTIGTHPFRKTARARFSFEDDGVDLGDIAKAQGQKTTTGANETDTTAHSPLPEVGGKQDVDFAMEPQCLSGATIKIPDHFRGHKRTHAALKIVTKDLPRDDRVCFPELTPTYSTAAIISPKPISPARELKVKNSIPQLMKALPPIPLGLHTTHVSAPTTPVAGDEFSEVLVPLSLSCAGILSTSRSPNYPRLFGDNGHETEKRLPSLQKHIRVPKIRLKSKGLGVPRANHRDSRPWNCDSNYPWHNDSQSLKFAEISNNETDLTPARRKFRLKGARTVRGNTPPATVRRNPDARNSEVVVNLVSQQRKDLFSLSNGLTDVFRQVSRKFSAGASGKLQSRREETSSLFNDSAASKIGQSEPAKPNNSNSPQANFIEQPESSRKSSRSSLPSHSSVLRQSRGLKKRFSNFRLLLARSPRSRRSAPPTEGLSVHPANTEELESLLDTSKIDPVGKGLAVSESTAFDTPRRRRFKRRVRDKIAKWMKHTGTAVKVRSSKAHAK